MARQGWFFVSFLCLMFSVFPAVAFNPPEDACGAVKLRIVGPDKLESALDPFPVELVLENSGETAVSGRVRLYGIDGWAAAPAEAQPFSAAPGESARLSFTVTPAPDSHNAMYPLHAVAELEPPVGDCTALHAVLITEMQRPDPPRPARGEAWRAWPVQDGVAKALLRYPARRVVWQVFGKEPQTSGASWGGGDPVTGASADFDTPRALPDQRAALAMHPCWRGGAGTVMAEFALALPETPLRLTFANAMRETTPPEPPSDGVTFRVRVAPFDAPEGAFGEVVYEGHTDAKTWQDGEADLSRWAGKAVRLQLESHPGPKNDTTCDLSLWGEPMLVPVNAAAASMADPKDSVNIGYGIDVTPGRRGLLDAKIQLEGSVGTLDLPLQMTPDERGLLDISSLLKDRVLVWKGLHVKVLGDDLGDGAGPTELLEVVSEFVPEEQSPHKRKTLRCRHKMRHGETNYDLIIELFAHEHDSNTPQIRFSLENTPPPSPWVDVHIEDAFLGELNRIPTRVYAGAGNVLCEPEDFSLGFDGHQLATSLIGFDFENAPSLLMGVDAPPTRLEFSRGPKRFTLHTAGNHTLTLIPCQNVWESVYKWPTCIDRRRAAPGVERLRGRMAIDLWGGRYAESAEALEKTFRYLGWVAEAGMPMPLVVWHNWQRHGYDYRLPDIFPPNPDYGTGEEFKQLAATCKDNGAIFAPHDNYIDFYPDAEGFSYKNISFSSSGDPVRGWLNEYRGAQAYRWATDGFWPSMEKNLGLIRDFCQPNGYFVDVWSSIGPYDSWTRDGKYQSHAHTRDAWGRAFTQIRESLGGAVTISESGHDQLIGQLDGSQCNHLRVDPDPPRDAQWMTWRIRCADSERIPWFDAVNHRRFVLHGAGYESRYRAGLDARLHGIYSDDYITTEVMTGRPPMVSEAFNRDVVRKGWLFAPMNILDLPKHGDFVWIDWVKFDGDNPHRQHIRWKAQHRKHLSGITWNVWVNRGEEDWVIPRPASLKEWETSETVTLPQYGFLLAIIPYPHDPIMAAAGITRKDGIIVEWSLYKEGETSLRYVNARPMPHDDNPVTVKAVAVEPGENRSVAVGLAWNCVKALERDWRPFVHFIDGDGNIAFQADHGFAVPTTQWSGPVESRGVAHIPADAPAGAKYEVYAGLWEPGHGRRKLDVVSDDQYRALLGTVTVTEEGIDWEAATEQPDPLLARMNPEGKMMDMLGMRTNGAALAFTLGNGKRGVAALPQGGPFQLECDGDWEGRWLKHGEDGNAEAMDIPRTGERTAFDFQAGTVGYFSGKPWD